jgi:hypothetical protein
MYSSTEYTGASIDMYERPLYGVPLLSDEETETDVLWPSVARTFTAMAAAWAASSRYWDPPKNRVPAPTSVLSRR